MNDLLTLIITCRERRVTLPRVLEYYRNCPYNIVLLDMSLKPYDDIDNYKYLKYVHMPNEIMWQGIRKVLENVHTKYTVDFADDDFLLLSSIDRCLEFLEKNEDYVCVGGQEVALKEDTLEYDTVEYLLENGFDINGKDYKERIKNSLSLFKAKNNFIFRRDVHYKIYDIIMSNPQFVAVRYIDKLLGIISSFYGKTAVINECTFLKSREYYTNPFLGRGLIFLEGVSKQIRSHLHFEKDFIKEDYEPLLKEIGLKKDEFIKIYKSFASKKDIIYKEISETYDVKCPRIDIDGFQLIPGEHYREKIAKSNWFDGNPQDVYPVYKKEAIEEIKKILSLAKAYPLNQWWHWEKNRYVFNEGWNIMKEKEGIEPLFYKGYIKSTYKEFEKFVKYDHYAACNFLKDLYEGKVLILTETLMEDEVVDIKRILQDFISKTEESEHKILERCPNFHHTVRVENPEKKGYSTSNHSCFFFRWNDETNSLLKYIHNIWEVIKIFGGYHRDEYEKSLPEDGVVDRIEAFYYPPKIGKITVHSDPVINQKTNICFPLEIGQPRTGLYFVDNNKKKHYLDSDIGLGACVIWVSTLFHGVDPSEKDGRWSMILNSVHSHKIKKRSGAKSYKQIVDGGID